jgi:hypothetical protein
VLVKCSFVTWQLRRLHAELDSIETRRDEVFEPDAMAGFTSGRRNQYRDVAARRRLLGRMLRTLPKHFGFRDARAFALAFARANGLTEIVPAERRRLSLAKIQELERRVLNEESPSEIARDLGCAKQTVLNRGSMLRKQLANRQEKEGSGI